MQRSYVFYFQLLLQAAFFGSLYASKSEVKHINDQEDEFENYRSIPAGVHCREFALIYRDGHTVTVCVGGSVKMDKWIDSALSLQRLLSYRRDICTTQIIGSKSSGNSMFYGYGATDHLYPDKSSKNYYQTSSQLFSIKDQLQLGVRFLELNVHFVQDAIKIANCNVNGESGCKEEYNGVPVENFQRVESLLQEIADWLKTNRNEFVFVIFNGVEGLNDNNQVGTLIGHIRGNFDDSMIYRPLDRPIDQKWPSTFDLLRKEKHIMFLTELDYSGYDYGYFFLKKSVCNWTENTPPLSDFPSCKFKKSGINAKKLYGNIDRVVSSELHFGEKDSNGHVGWNMYPLNETRIPNMVRCGVNVVSPDNITPARMEKRTWQFG
ncbi:unnamed protein product [Albugo candida]|uniref:Phosphatidylinositol-specific phospholipase C X domain-containing protein n=1 Tax=Albugo candida TaxID=65357 RepID=A0A024GMD2_9STRA|nr:unnamed protein product [Albugo candida]|eukprot:CCI47902.1 unnamed protein product [Albugo candida]